MVFPLESVVVTTPPDVLLLLEVPLPLDMPPEGDALPMVPFVPAMPPAVDATVVV